MAPCRIARKVFYLMEIYLERKCKVLGTKDLLSKCSIQGIYLVFGVSGGLGRRFFERVVCQVFLFSGGVVRST